MATEDSGPDVSAPNASTTDEPAADVSPRAESLADGAAYEKALHIGKPAWLKTDIPTGETYFRIKRDLRDRKLFTVCEEAKCPNIGQCWNTNTATFMILGEVCTRGCRFCHVKTGNPAGVLDHDEPRQVAESAAQMRLKYVVITMVDRDDLVDGGSAHVARVVEAVRAASPAIRIELLVGDFRARDASISTVLDSRPDVYAHNIETVERLTPRVRDARANYRQSLATLARAKELAGYDVLTKSAIMLGLGEEKAEVEQALRDLRSVGVDFVTLGQYLRPTRKHLSIKRWVEPKEFDGFAAFARSIGFISVASAPLVRSSFRAREFFETATGIRL